MFAAVAGEVAVVAVDHGQAGAHVAGEVEGRDAGTEREGREGVPEIVDPSQWVDARGLLCGPPSEGAEVVDVEVAASLAGKEQRRAIAVFDPVEGVDRASLERDRSRAGLGLRE